MAGIVLLNTRMQVKEMKRKPERTWMSERKENLERKSFPKELKKVNKFILE